MAHCCLTDVAKVRPLEFHTQTSYLNLASELHFNICPGQKRNVPIPYSKDKHVSYLYMQTHIYTTNKSSGLPINYFTSVFRIQKRFPLLTMGRFFLTYVYIHLMSKLVVYVKVVVFSKHFGGRGSFHRFCTRLPPLEADEPAQCIKKAIRFIKLETGYLIISYVSLS